MTQVTGPLDVLLVRFPGNRFKGEIAPALGDLVAEGLVRVVDLVFVTKDADGNVSSLEVADLAADLESVFIDLDGEAPGGLLDEEDVVEAGSGLEPNSSVAVLVVENLWAVPFITAMKAAGAEVIDQARIPSDLAADAVETLSSTR